MDGIIVYQSQFGATETYALWIAEETGYQPVPVQTVTEEALQSADQVILGCSIINGKPKLSGWIQKKWALLRTKKPLLFTTSGAAPTDPVLTKYFSRSFPSEIQQELRYFPLGGRMIFDKLSWVMKLLLRVGHTFQQDPEVKARLVENVDWIDRESIKPILSQIALA